MSSISPTEVPVTLVMTKKVRTVTRDLPIDELSQLFLEDAISGAPVVDPEGRPIGMVTKTDLIRRRCSSCAIVDDIMTGEALALPEEATVSQAAALMASERIHRVVVVSGEGRIVGLVSALDVLRWMASANGTES